MLVLISIPYWRCGTGEALPFFEDVVAIHHPMKVALAAALEEHRLPLWSPHVLSGYPMVAEGQVGALYPPNLVLFTLLPVTHAYGLGLVVHFLLSGAGMFFFARELGLSPPARMISALAFTFSGFFFGHIAHLNFVHAGAWLPLMFYCAEAASRRGEPRFALLWAAAFAMQLLASAPQIALYSVAASGAYFAYRRGSLRLAASALVLGVALSAVQTVPQYELAALSSRGEGLSYAATMLGSLPPPNLVTYLWPSFFGVSDLDRVMYPGEALQWGLVGWWEASVYVGVLPFLFAVFAALARDRSVARFFLLLAGLSLIVAFGKFTPLGHLLYRLPGFSLFRIPARFTFLTTFAACVLAGIGVDRLRVATEWSRVGPLARNLLLLHLVVLGVANAACFGAEGWTRSTLQQLVERRLADSVVAERDEARASVDATAIAARMYGSIARSVTPWKLSTALPLGALACMWLVGSLGRRRGSPPAWLGSACVIATFVDLYAVNAKLVPLTPVAAIATPPASVGLLPAEATPYRTWFAEEIPRWWQAEVIDGAEDRAPDPTSALRDYLLPNTNMVYSIDSIGSANLLIWSRYAEILEDVSARSPMRDVWLDVLNVKYLIAPREVAEVPGRTRLARTDGKVWIYENLTALPRAWLVHQVRVVPPAAPTERWDPAEEALLEQDPAIRPSAAAGGDRTEILTYRDREVVLRTSSSAAAVLILADLYFPGWKAFVDGKEAKILRADYVLRGVALPAGSHDVRFVYEPWSLTIGLAISLTATIVLLGACAVQGVRKLGPR